MDEYTITFEMDDVEIKAKPGETIMAAADRAGVYIPRLCAMKELTAFGACRVCTVLVNGRAQAACTQPVGEGIIVENDTEKVNQMRRDLVEMMQRLRVMRRDPDDDGFAARTHAD